MEVHALEWIVLIGIIAVMITIDLVGHVRTPHAPSLKEATWWSIGYVAMGLAFGLFVLWDYGPVYAGEYYAGYITEKSLSVDNLFVFVIIIAAFKVPRKYQQQVLMYGIVMALVMRAVFIAIGAAVINEFAWVFYIFGAFLIWTAIAQARQGVEDPEQHDAEEYKENALVRGVRKVFPVTDGYRGTKLTVKEHGTRAVTPLFIAIVAIGTADLMFAVDSIPAIFGLTQEPYLVFAANAFSLLGLRQLYFLIDGLLDRLVYLHYGLAAILGFIGVKLIIHALHENELPFINGGEPWHAIPEPSIAVSLGWIVGVLAVTVVASIWKNKKDERAAKEGRVAAAEPRADASPADRPQSGSPADGARSGSPADPSRSTAETQPAKRPRER